MAGVMQGTSMARRSASGCWHRVAMERRELVSRPRVPLTVQIAEAVKIQVSDLHSEHVFNSGDVGRPAKILAKEFPWLNFTGLKDTWWYSPKDAPNDPLIGLFQSRESMDHLRKRVGAFRQFLLSRTEQRIIVIGHSTFFRELGSGRMKNCEILTIRI